MININKHYSTLNIPVNSELSEAKKAYKKLALKHHPDRGGDPKKFQEIATAYEEIEKYKSRPQHNMSPHIINSNIHEVFSNDMNNFNFIFNNHFNNLRTQHNVYSQQQHHDNIPSSKTIRISTKVVNGISKTVIEETDTRSGKTIIRNY
jgi:DnaJ-class molecular chaperone